MSDMRTLRDLMEMPDGEQPADLFLIRWHREVVRLLPRAARMEFDKLAPERVELHSFVVVPVHEQGKGHGTTTMELVCALADATAVTVDLVPEPESLDRLVPFYTRFGFFCVATSKWMRRLPD